MTTATIDYEAYEGKKVALTTEDDADLEGTVEAGSAIGIVFKPRGSSRGIMIPAEKIVTIHPLRYGPKKLRARTLPRVLEGKHREHLIERHGYKLSEIQGMTEESARDFHDGLDHSDLGHKHKELTPVEQAIAEAAEDDGPDDELPDED